MQLCIMLFMQMITTSGELVPRRIMRGFKRLFSVFDASRLLLSLHVTVCPFKIQRLNVYRDKEM